MEQHPQQSQLPSPRCAITVILPRERELFHREQWNWRFSSYRSRQILLAVLEKQAEEYDKYIEKKVEDAKCDQQ